MGYFKRYSIQAKIMFFFISLAVLLFITVGLLFFRSTEGAINSSKRNELVTMSYETANKIDRFLFERYGDIQVMADSPLLKNYGIDKKLKYYYLESVRNAYKTYDYIFVTDSKGKIDILSGDIKGDHEYNKWIYKVLGGRLYVSDFTYIKSEKAYSIYFASPIKGNDGKILGAVVERMKFDAISDIVRKVRIGKNGYAYLYARNGSIMYEPPKFSRDFSVGEVKNGPGTIYVNHSGVKYISTFYPVKKYDTQQNTWYLMVEEPYSEAFQVTENLRNYTILLILISILALFVLAVIMSEIITKPIKKLVTETQNIVDGNIGSIIEVESRDEIGKLAHSFNSLLDSLKSMMQQVLDISGEAASLADVRQYADRFFENIPSAIITINNAGDITTFNYSASKITEIKKDEILGRNIKGLENIGIAGIIELLLDGIEKQVIYIKHIIKIKNVSGEEIPVMINTSIQRDSNDNLIGVIGAFKLVEEIKQFEESVVRAKNLASLGALSAGMAHEIRNPLTSIKGYAQYIKSELGESDELVSDISVIINEVDRLNGIIDRFLSFARPQELKLRLYNVNDIVKEVVKLISIEVDEANIKIKEDYGELPPMQVDTEQMEQALLNIVINSIQAMPKGGVLDVTTNYDKTSEFVEIKIADTGGGIQIEDFEKIFEPFYTTKNKGTGLGLAISSRIIENHKGFIEVSSTPGAGARFILKLPIKY